MIPKSIMAWALKGDISAIQGVLMSINSDIWESSAEKDAHDIEECLDGAVEPVCQDSDKETTPRELNEEERRIVEQLSENLLSRLDTLTDAELLTVMQTPLIDKVPFVKLLAGHGNPTALFRYSWMLQGGEEAHGVIPDMAESVDCLNRAVDRVCEMTGNLNADMTHEKEEIKAFDYHIRSNSKCLKAIESLINALCRKKGLPEGIDIEMPIGPVMYLLAGGDGGGYYRGTIRRMFWLDDVLVLSAECVGISSGAFKAAFQIFFGDVDIDMKPQMPGPLAEEEFVE